MEPCCCCCCCGLACVFCVCKMILWKNHVIYMYGTTPVDHQSHFQEKFASCPECPRKPMWWCLANLVESILHSKFRPKSVKMCFSGSYNFWIRNPSSYVFTFFFCWILCKNPQICQDIIVRATICQSWSYVYIFFLLDFVFRNRRSVGRIIPCNVPRFGQRAFWAQVDRSAASLETESQGRR